MGLPDWSGWFEAADDRARRVFSASAEQLVNTTQRATEAATELQREVSRVMDIQTSTVAQTLQYGLQELGEQTSEGLNQLVETAREQAEEAERTASEMGEQMRQGLRDITERLGIEAVVAGFGSVFVTYFMSGPANNYTDLLRNDVNKFVTYRRRMIERGIYKLPVNLKRNHISLAHTQADIDRTLETAEEVLKELS